MPIRFSAAIALCALAFPVGAAPLRAVQQPATRTPFEELFRAAMTDSSAVVPLLVEGSRLLASLPPESAPRLGDTLEPFARRVFFGHEVLPGMERFGLRQHVVAKGETPTSIAARYDTGPGLLAYLNQGFDARRLRVGQNLKVLDVAHGELEIEIDRGTFRLAMWRRLAEGGRVLVLYTPVGVGAADSPTPTGSTRITKRVLQPQWTDPDTRQVFAPTDPRNVLGGYWIALDPDGLGGRRGIGIHGYTGAPSDDWLSKQGSHGCIRMLQRDVDRVYHTAVEGTLVELR